MVGMDGALGIAAGGLANINRQLAIVSQNVANANTADYAREVGQQASAAAAGIGIGVHTLGVVRELDAHIQKAAFSQNAQVSESQTRNAALSSIDAVQGTPGQGNDLSSLLGKLQDAFTSLDAQPSSAAAQNAVVGAATALASQINTMSSAYQSARQTAQDDIETGVGQVNAALATLTDLSTRIVNGRQAGQSTADLENQRDSALHTLSGLVEIGYAERPDGSLLLSTKAGMGFVLQQPAPQLGVASAQTAPGNFYPGGGIGGITLNGVDVTGQLAGGSLGANLSLRDTVLPTYQGEIDEFANTLQSRLQAQGLQLFTPPSPSVPSASVTQSGYIGYGGTIAVNPSVLASPSIVRDGNVTVAGSATGATAFTPNPAGGPASFSGLITRILSFGFGAEVQNGANQPAPVVAGLGPQGSLQAPFAAPATLAQFATALVSTQSLDVSNGSAKLDSDMAVQTALQAQLSASSSVNIDSEMSKMITLQNAYGANARIISAVQAMWTQLLQTVT